ncbi:hypothetical protein B0T24DRAFT_625203 [Lasiosphaeria ovina]|uniref:Uncharacterized protein n=1 Tax=Lasiosphaeria ovina TaxID=92902 RepID=A0AAE0N8H4_9PEZI|nr:hypothetical protein B0T24DRAFT_625203 [Lasiosphaeria ovina]
MHAIFLCRRALVIPAIWVSFRSLDWTFSSLIPLLGNPSQLLIPSIITFVIYPARQALSSAATFEEWTLGDVVLKRVIVDGQVPF